jgi:hypothetical protein
VITLCLRVSTVPRDGLDEAVSGFLPRCSRPYGALLCAHYSTPVARGATASLSACFCFGLTQSTADPKYGIPNACSG